MGFVNDTVTSVTISDATKIDLSDQELAVEAGKKFARLEVAELPHFYLIKSFAVKEQQLSKTKIMPYDQQIVRHYFFAIYLLPVIGR